MGLHRWTLLVVAAASLLTVGCVAVPQQDRVKEVHICTGKDCETSVHKYTVEQLATGLQQLLKENEGQKVIICASDSKTRTCESVGVCYLVIGGIIPGNGCAKSIVFSEVAQGSQAGQVSLKANMPLTFIWMPAPCETTSGTLAIRSANEIALEFQPSVCAFLGVGVFKATFNIAVESFDLTKGQISGYWSHASAGTGNGRGSGYMVLQFPKPMPPGDNWLVEQPASPVRREQLLGAHR